MALRIRLKRFGAKKQPTYRLVIADSRAARDGKFVESVGFYNPLPEPATIQVDTERTREWLRRGAQPSESVRQVLIRAGLWEQVSGKSPATPAGAAAESAKDGVASSTAQPATDAEPANGAAEGA